MTRISSKFAADEDWQELLNEFIAGIPERVESLNEAFAKNNLEVLTFLVHQLKGACGSYGFQSVTQMAAEFESHLRSSSDIEALERELAMFQAALQSMSAGQPSNAS